MSLNSSDPWEDSYRMWKNQRKRNAQFPEEHAIKFTPPKSLAPPFEMTPLQQKKIVYAIAVIIPLAIALYLLYNHVLIEQTFVYHYDIGSPEDNYLTPKERISEKYNDTLPEYNYRNLTSALVYFEVPIARLTDTITVQVRFKNNFPRNATLSIGAKDQADWHYRWQEIFTNTCSQNEWITEETTFNRTGLSIQNNKLSLILNTPHLSNTQSANNTIPIDEIITTVHKKGFFS